MCTVTFLARKRGYALGMNRDETLSRVPGLPPAKKQVNGCGILSPAEPGGGTWIALNDTGGTFALINWYAVSTQVKGKTVSRGWVVNSVCAAPTPDLAAAALVQLPLNQINPFRLIGIFPASRKIVEWRWDLKKLLRQKQRWQNQQWISSGFDEPAAQRVRSRTFRAALKQKSAGRLDWLRRLHRSHAPQCGPFSTCMHRAAAATVSYTEVAIFSGRAFMRYQGGPPCICGAMKPRKLSLKHSALHSALSFKKPNRNHLERV